MRARTKGDLRSGPNYPKVKVNENLPCTSASTTETATTSSRGLAWSASRFLLIGYADNLAPDHMDQLHALPVFLKWMRKPSAGVANGMLKRR